MTDPAPRIRRGLGEPASSAPATSGKAEPAPARPSARRGLGETPATASAIGDAAASSAPAAADAPLAPASPAATPGRSRTSRWLVLAVVVVVLAAAVIVGARLLVGSGAVADFLTDFPGEYPLPDSTAVGIPTWASWSHFLNAFFLVLIIRSGWKVRTERKPPAMWTRDNSRWPKTRTPPRKISITLFLHLVLDLLWLVNGAVFVILLFASGHWARIVPTSWEVFPNALSAALQYASLDWPTENGWLNYNSLQQLAYFVTVFVAAPLAAVTGVRMSGFWSPRWTRLSRWYPIELARAVHFPVMLYFVLFLIAHVTLVFAAGALRNLNHMYGGQDAVNWVGAIIFGVSLLVMAGAWLAARPAVIAPIAGLLGKVGR